MQFYGCYIKTLKRDELTGQTTFTVSTSDESIPLTPYGNVCCCGIIPAYIEGMPLYLAGEFISSEYGQTLELTSCKEGCNDFEKAKTFLSGSLFSGVGPKIAEELVKTVGCEIFEAAKSDDFISHAMDAGLTQEKAILVANKLKSFESFRNLLELLYSNGGTYEQACLLSNAHPNDGADILTKKPYSTMQYGVSFAVCEKFARKRGIGPFNEVRLGALIDECLRMVKSSGSTAVSFKNLCSLTNYIEWSVRLGDCTNAFHIGATILDNDDRYTIWQDGDEWYISLKSMLEQEQNIASHIKWLSSENKLKEIDYDLVSAIEKESTLTYSKEQKEAFELLKYPGVKILTGGPGTGKTTILNGLIKYYAKTNPKKVVRCASPTATAARKMTASTGRSASTVHKMLGLNALGEVASYATDAGPLPSGLIVVDEASMLDTDLFEKLLEKVSPGSILLIVGDEDQLESIGAGNVLADLLSDDSIPKCRLQTVYRQDETSSLFANSVKIRQGNADLACDDRTVIYRTDSIERLVEMATKCMEKEYDPKNPLSVKFLSPVRSQKYPYSTTAFNEIFQAAFNPDNKSSLIYGGIEYRVGDPVQFTKNNYKAGYINGDFGMVKAVIKDGGYRGLTITVEDKDIDVSGAQLADIALAYAGTVHKTQGGECDVAIVVVPAKPKGMLHRKLTYVASTRAKKKNIFIVEDHSLEYAIKNTGHKSRVTGLRHLLKGD